MTTLTSTSALVSSTDATTDFEKEFRQAIEESGMNWHDNSTPQLPASTPIQQDRERRQMARVRTLLRAEQIRARRLKKIKSKSYRKLLRKKEMQGMAELIAKLDKDDPEAAEQVKDELEKKLSSMRLNRQRQARLKWSKAAQRFGGQEMRSEISKQAQAESDEKRELLRAIKGKSNDDSDSDSDSLSGSADDDDIVAQIKKTIKSKVIGSSSTQEDASDRGLMGMKFMRDAATKQRNQTVAEATDFIETLERSDDSDSEDDGGSSDGAEEEDTQESLVASLFAAPVQTPVSKSASSSGLKLKRPEREEDGLPGWGDWVGEGLKERAPKRKAAEVPKTHAPSSAVLHMADEQAIRAPLMKYQVKEVPYPYKSRAEYEAATANPVGPEWMSLTAHVETIQPKICARIGAVVHPIKLAKHLDADKRAKLIDAWDNRKRPKHTKARFL